MLQVEIVFPRSFKMPSAGLARFLSLWRTFPTLALVKSGLLAGSLVGPLTSVLDPQKENWSLYLALEVFFFTVVITPGCPSGT